MSSSAFALPLTEETFGPNVGELVSAKLEELQAFERLLREAEQRSYAVENPTIDNLPFLMEQAGAIDESRVLRRWQACRQFGAGYSGYVRYGFKRIRSKRLLKYSEAQKFLPALLYRATVYELLAAFNGNKTALMPLLEQGARIMAIGKTHIDLGTGYYICLDSRRKLVLRSFAITPHFRIWWTDLVLGRYRSPQAPL